MTTTSDTPVRTDGAVNVDILGAAKVNTAFRRVISTGPNAQVVVMCIPSGGEIGLETHAHVDQVLVIVDGEGIALLDGAESPVTIGRLVHVPAGTEHNIVNTGSANLRLYTVYAPPQHAATTVHLTKAEADADEADHAPRP
jgi:mannose-6-phosphate isomerase-like protein (cupin superfamily)